MSCLMKKEMANVPMAKAGSGCGGSGCVKGQAENKTGEVRGDSRGVRGEMGELRGDS